MKQVLTPLVKFMILCCVLAVGGLLGTIVTFIACPKYSDYFFYVAIISLIVGFVTGKIAYHIELNKKKKRKKRGH